MKYFSANFTQMSDTKCSSSRTVTYGRTDAVEPQASKKDFFFFVKISKVSPWFYAPTLNPVEPLARFSYASLLTYYLFVLQLRISGCQVQCMVHDRSQNRPSGWTANRKYMSIPSRTDSLEVSKFFSQRMTTTVLPEAHSSDGFPTVTRVVYYIGVNPYPANVENMVSS